jgi:hypothetical protein
LWICAKAVWRREVSSIDSNVPSALSCSCSVFVKALSWGVGKDRDIGGETPYWIDGVAYPDGVLFCWALEAEAGEGSMGDDLDDSPDEGMERGGGKFCRDMMEEPIRQDAGQGIESMSPYRWERPFSDGMTKGGSMYPLRPSEAEAIAAFFVPILWERQRKGWVDLLRI